MHNSWARLASFCHLGPSINGLVTDGNSKLCCRGFILTLFQSNKVAKIRNRYNQVPHLTQDTNGKVTNSQKTPQSTTANKIESGHTQDYKRLLLVCSARQCTSNIYIYLYVSDQSVFIGSVLQFRDISAPNKLGPWQTRPLTNSAPNKLGPHIFEDQIRPLQTRPQPKYGSGGWLNSL